ncbi:hypothetical protein J2Z32_002124 [Paenibacillus turicensis]|uniref:Uncharacterized protein n=1 Tax=Paenibacillus turicensis TaxID=160487 RepID=A0ABS4FSD6_9BACL|nr:hypothetical protein [Paenibacillus turicensis]MBP1905494.1 hypothetical protein [Paenibacillus turicensis]
MKKIKIDGCDAFIIKENLVVIVDIERGQAILTRLSELDGVQYPNADRGVHFETPLTIQSLHKIFTAESELDLLISAVLD